jgi:hypothetical protein
MRYAALFNDFICAVSSVKVRQRVLVTKMLRMRKVTTVEAGTADSMAGTCQLQLYSRDLRRNLQ